MATSKLVIKNGRIASHYDPYFQDQSQDGKQYWGNGWSVTIKDGRNGQPGRIICHAERLYSTGPAICHREFKLADGTLGLAGGNICSRYAYFRGEDFQKFLTEHGISAVKREDPNTVYTLRNAFYGGGSCSMSIRTDGTTERIRYDSGRTEQWAADYPGTSACECEDDVRVIGATWVIVDKSQDEGSRHNCSHILYTLVKDVTKLDIPSKE